jgi:hypothetical protein
MWNGDGPRQVNACWLSRPPVNHIGGFDDKNASPSRFGPVKWGSRSLILCGDIVKAVRHESRAAVAYHWGVAPETVKKWRRALDVETNNAGSAWVMRSTAIERATPRRIGQMIEKARQVNRVPKSKEWQRRMSQIIRSRIALSGTIDPRHALWKPEDDQLPWSAFCRACIRRKGNLTLGTDRISDQESQISDLRWAAISTSQPN